jgi:hypothetical protein
MILLPSIVEHNSFGCLRRGLTPYAETHYNSVGLHDKMTRA